MAHVSRRYSPWSAAPRQEHHGGSKAVTLWYPRSTAQGMRHRDRQDPRTTVFWDPFLQLGPTSEQRWFSPLKRTAPHGPVTFPGVSPSRGQLSVITEPQDSCAGGLHCTLLGLPFCYQKTSTCKGQTHFYILAKIYSDEMH